MKIGIVAPSSVPLERGGAERLWNGLARSLDDAGHLAEVFRLPVREHRLNDLLRGYLDMAALDLSHLDVVISGKYPAWAVDHPRHVVWMLHPLRGLYDTFPAEALARHTVAAAMTAAIEEIRGETEPILVVQRLLEACSGLDDDHLRIPSATARAAVRFLDGVCLHPRRIERHAAISHTVAARAGYFPAGVDVSVAYPAIEPPLPETDDSHGRADDGTASQTLICVGRLDSAKRVALVIEGYRQALDDGGLSELLIVGDGPDRARLARLASGTPSIRFTGRVSDRELDGLYRSARAAVFVPLDEDYGYVTAEALARGLPVVTASDSGGVTELVIDGQNGLVAEPTAAGLASALRRLDDATVAKLRAGARASQSVDDWARVHDTLLAGRPGADRSTRSSRRLVALSTYPVEGEASGGPERAAALLGEIAATGLDVTIISLDANSDRTIRRSLTHGVEEVTVPVSPRFVDAERQIRRAVGEVAITDVAAGLMWPAVPAFERELRDHLAQADAVLLVQPYLHPAVDCLAPHLPLIADEHNIEYELKSAMYPTTEAGRWLLDRVLEIERRAVTSADIVAATTADDVAALSSSPFRVPANRIIAVPNGVDPTGIEASDVSIGGLRDASSMAAARARVGLPLEGTVAVFVGSSHRPNIDAARRIVGAAKRHPHVTVALVGSHVDHIEGHLPPNVRRFGAVDDHQLNEVLATADVALNPMRDGGGSNLKLLRYFAAGVPVITSSVGARGVSSIEQLATVDDGDDPLARVDAARGAEGQAAALRARDWVVASASWSAIAQPFVERVITILDKAGR